MKYLNPKRKSISVDVFVVVCIISGLIGAFIRHEESWEIAVAVVSILFLILSTLKLKAHYQHDELNMFIKSHTRTTLAEMLKDAINRHDVQVHYQPKIDLKTGEICGVEALSRWSVPEIGIITPSRFVKIAERYSLTEPLTEYVVNECVRQYKRWQILGIETDISINVSARDIHNSNIIMTLSNILSTNSVPPERIILEVTETSIMKDMNAALKVLEHLNTLGVRLSIDDFGTGHSSLLYLKHLPISEIKIDKVFVADITANDQDAKIVQSTIDLAHMLNCNVVAEGVENQEVFDAITTMKCDVVQGFYCAKPLNPDELIVFMKRKKKNNEQETGHTRRIQETGLQEG